MNKASTHDCHIPHLSDYIYWRRMEGDLFGDLPPPSSKNLVNPATATAAAAAATVTTTTAATGPKTNPLPPAPLKSALKRPKPLPSSPPADGGSQKKLKFKMTTDASLSQIVEAMQKIASHIKNLPKFSKASKLAIQLIQAGSVKPEMADNFFGILEAAMESPTTCHDASVRSDYHALFSAVQDASECLSTRQKNQLAVWTIRAVVGNDLYTDDSFVFSKAAGRIKDLISSLPVATKEDDSQEAASLEGKNEEVKPNQDVISSNKSAECPTTEESDPFGLDALISTRPKKDDTVKEKKGKEEEDDLEIFMKLQREALISCLDIAAKRYKTPWCQTVIDILVNHAHDNISRFTARQRDAIEKLWISIREQLTRRKQGKSVSGKLDVTAFEFLQEKYSHEKISIRRAVGGSGDRRCTQWLG